MYLRFVIADISDGSHRELGIFHAARKLLGEEKLQAHEKEIYSAIVQWFSDNLQTPTRFTASKPPFYRKKCKAISWFKDTAREHLSRVRELLAILGNHGILVRMLKTNRVGYIVYEDEFQVVAEAFADT